MTATLHSSSISEGDENIPSLGASKYGTAAKKIWQSVAAELKFNNISISNVLTIKHNVSTFLLPVLLTENWILYSEML